MGTKTQTTTPATTPVAVQTAPAVCTPTGTLPPLTGMAPPTAIATDGVDFTALFGNPATMAAAARTRPVAFGVQPNAKTRAYHAGVAIAKHGHANGIPPHMAAAVCAAFGVANATESAICLRNAWHAIRGFCNAAGIALPPAAGTNGNGVGS